MSNRIKVTLGMFAYLTGCSYFFGVVFSGNKGPFVILSGLLALAVAQFIAMYILYLVIRADKQDRAKE